MAEQQQTTERTVVAQISEMLNEEKWTRATLNSYTVNNFKELDDVLDTVFDAGLQDEVNELCEEHLQHTKNSIIALYLSGIIHLHRQTVDDTNLVMLINIFTDNHKWSIVEYLASRILDFGENKYALRTLADCYDSENLQDQKYEVWERLIRVDFEEADIVRRLAERREEEGDVDAAVDYYKKALHRYINKRSFNNIKEIWHRLNQYIPEETEFFFHAETKIAKSVSEERAVQLLEDYYPHFKKKEDWDTAIEVLKRVLSYDSRNPWARKEIVDCYRAKYADHSHLEEYVRLSNLNQSWRNIHDAIADFEKHISFDAGNFVFHRSWGVGIIREIKDDSIRIDFARKRGHEMSLKMAVSALEILPRDHIWVLRSVWKKDKLHDKVKNDPVWALKIVIKSLGNAADMKRIKAELVPHILSPGEWSSWSAKARQILKTNKQFGNLTDKLDHFVVRDQPISFEEKTFNKFKAEKTFFDRFKTFSEYLDHVEKNDEIGTDSEFFREMYEYFVGFLRSQGAVNEYVVSSNMVVRRLVEKYPFLNPAVDLDFEAMFNGIRNLEEVFNGIENNELRKMFMQDLRRFVPEWPDYYTRLFPHHLSRDIIAELERNGHAGRLADLFSHIHNNYRDMREAFVWLVRNCRDDKWFRELHVEQEKILIAMIHLLDITAREIDNRKDVSANRKLNRQVHNYLFKDQHLHSFIDNADPESLNRIFTLVSDAKGLDPALVLELKQRILNRYPNFKFYGETEAQTVSRGFIVAAKSYEEKSAQLRHIHEVEVPDNSKEISEALQHGDLSENAEYKAAKERQDMLNNSAAKLKEELDRAQIMRRSDVDPSTISFGTVVRLTNLETDDTEEYTVMGPWESDPDQAIISYLSPLGGELYNHKAGEELHFEINDREYHYRVEEIRVAEF
jgi:transcription elongation factor GreA